MDKIEYIKNNNKKERKCMLPYIKSVEKWKSFKNLAFTCFIQDEQLIPIRLK